MKKHWYWYKYHSKGRKVQGYCPARSKLEVARFADYPISELHIEQVNWNGEEFVK